MPKVAVDAYVAPEAVLAGQVTVYDGASVWSGSVLRGDLNKITLGFCANVQERCVLHAAWSAPTGHLPRLIRFYNLPSRVLLLDLASYAHLVTVLPFWDARDCDAEW
jgi:carbonic anhydrase/acetyltransferase-like protein (isoleucine patch superfamily)